MINVKETIAIIGAGPGVGYAVAERFGINGFNVALISVIPRKEANCFHGIFLLTSLIWQAS